MCYDYLPTLALLPMMYLPSTCPVPAFHLPSGTARALLRCHPHPDPLSSLVEPRGSHGATRAPAAHPAHPMGTGLGPHDHAAHGADGVLLQACAWRAVSGGVVQACAWRDVTGGVVQACAWRDVTGGVLQACALRPTILSEPSFHHPQLQGEVVE